MQPLACWALVSPHGPCGSDGRPRLGISLRVGRLLPPYLSRTERLIRVADLGCYSVVILALGGIVGYALRVRLGRPPALSPIEDLLALAIVGLALVWLRRSQAHTMRKYRNLSQVFGSRDELQ